MTHRIFLILLFTWFSLAAYAQELGHGIILSDSSQISLITISPGKELETRFGHSAIRVYDPALSLDVAFNYGTFDFDTPGFYIKFLRGKLLYFLNAYGFELMHREYMQVNQSVYEQKLNLTLKEKQEVFNFLLTNYKPENRYYLYDFFYDNCSSRIRDVFKNILGDKLQFRDSVEQEQTFRHLTDADLEVAPWEKFGVDLVLGLPADKLASPWNRMFLPHEMMIAFGQAKIKHDSTVIPFAQPVKTIYKKIPIAEKPGFFTPMNLFAGILILIIVLTFIQLYMKKKGYWVDIILFSISGLLGLAILFMWFGTDHLETRNNLNVLWALPLNFLIPYYLIRNPENKTLRIYLILNTLLNILLLLSWKIFPQHFNLADIPIILIFITRGLYLLYLNIYNPFTTQTKPVNHVD